MASRTTARTGEKAAFVGGRSARISQGPMEVFRLRSAWIPIEWSPRYREELYHQKEGIDMAIADLMTAARKCPSIVCAHLSCPRFGMSFDLQLGLTHV
jgi:hypothetical protein